MASESDLKVLRRLVGMVSRAFYEQRQVVIMDILCNINSCKDDELARKLNTTPKDVNRLCARLKTDGLIRTEETKGGTAVATADSIADPNWAKKKPPRNVYYIDYKQFVDIVKLRLYKISQLLGGSNQEDATEKKIKCTSCDNVVPITKVGMLKQSADGFLCDLCDSVMEFVESQNVMHGAGERYKIFMDESKPLLDLLKLTDKMKIPEYTPTPVAKESSQSAPKAGNVELRDSEEAGAVATVVVQIQEDAFDFGASNSENATNASTNGKEDPTDSYLEQYRQALAESGRETEFSNIQYGEDDVFEEVPITMPNTMANSSTGFAYEGSTSGFAFGNDDDDEDMDEVFEDIPR
ncbi:hypothetical protein BJ742DRAFT_786028 [Cladochytrium replicatum]|nr:hypothetical protein BJ742DRAFT_786028 [Cladochytrium replicatum]